MDEKWLLDKTACCSLLDNKTELINFETYRKCRQHNCGAVSNAFRCESFALIR